MKNFNDFYTNVLMEDNHGLEELRKKENEKMLSICLVIFFCIILSIVLPENMKWILFLALGFLIMYAISVFKSSKDYTVEFKTKIMNKMVTGFDEFKLYEPNRGISSSLYREGNFERYDYYTSEDYFSGKIKEKYAIEIGEVHTEAETTDDEGNKHRTTMFHGLFAHIDIPTNFVGSILICSDRGRLGKKYSKKMRVEMDSSDFEKKFDVFADDKLKAMQVLTPDVMDTLIGFLDLYKIKYEIKIFNNKIFIRFNTGPVFEPQHMKKTVDYDFLKKYYDILQFAVRASDEIIKGIEQIV